MESYQAEEKHYQIALSCTEGVGDKTLKQLIYHCGTAKEVFQSTLRSLSKIPGVGTHTARSILKKKYLSRAEETLARAEQEQSKILFFTDPEYPKRLRQIYDSPSLLYTKGAMALNAEKMIAIVGTRRATAYGKEITTALVSGLKHYGVTIVSGLAYGIDIAAHKAAVQEDIPTIGVMASGLNIIYPSAHAPTVSTMMENGGVVTESYFDVAPEAPRFPARNRIIAGLVDAVIVVEAAKKGGALITAELANGYDRDVFAIPGHIRAPYSEGCNNLIKSHKAHLLNDAKDLEYIMRWLPGSTQAAQSPAIAANTLSEAEKKIVSSLQGQAVAVSIDELLWQTNIAMGQLSSVLLEMEFKGLIASLPGKKYSIARAC